MCTPLAEGAESRVYRGKLQGHPADVVIKVYHNSTVVGRAKKVILRRTEFQLLRLVSAPVLLMRRNDGCRM